MNTHDVNFNPGAPCCRLQLQPDARRTPPVPGAQCKAKSLEKRRRSRQQAAADLAGAGLAVTGENSHVLTIRFSSDYHETSETCLIWLLGRVSTKPLYLPTKTIRLSDYHHETSCKKE